ncbi:condensation domain-containing protein [Sphingobacterium sp. ML3W]|uniref:condensation domain-containing protein n=1 Tax=Sphingobacterium sp. ML3W TaxID=1538644 RepID=UPI003FA7A8A1
MTLILWRTVSNYRESSVFPVVRFSGAVSFRRDEGDLLCLLCHHLVVDGVSWRILVEDLSHLYQGMFSGRGHDLPSKTDSYATGNRALSVIVGVRHCRKSPLTGLL